MEQINYFEVEKKIDKQDILDFQFSIECEFPKDFIDHYLKHNGGYPNANWSEGEEINYPFEHFLSIKYGVHTIEKKLKEFNEIGFDYGKKIIFAIKDIRYTFFIDTDITTEDYGKIYVRKPQYIKELKTFDISKGTWEYHCPNFTEFLNGLNQINYKPRI
jgi:hypothetical protein